jgi:DNA-binding transcriptional LysR family regulator
VGRQKLPSLAAVLAAQQSVDLQHSLSNLRAQGYKPVADWMPTNDAPTLRIGMSPAAALMFAPLIEARWREEHPNGLLRIVSGTAPELLGGLLEKTLDLVIAPQPRGYQPSHLKRANLYTSEPTIYARLGHSLAQATSLSEIAGVGWAVTGRSGTPGSVIEEAHRVRSLPQPKVLVQCNDYPTLLEVVTHSDLMAVVPHSLLVPKGQASSLAPLKIREGLPQYEVCAFWQSASSTRFGKTIESIVEVLSRASD